MTLYRDRIRFLLCLLGVAVGGAAFAVAFRAAASFVYRTAFGAGNVVDAIKGLPLWLRLVVPVAGGSAAGVIARLRPRSQNVSNVMEAVALGNIQLSFRTTVARVLASWVSIACGLSIGREGPLIEFGGALGASLGRIAGTTLREVRVLVAAGTAGGFASAYNTPFAAVLFVLETIAGIAALEVLLPVIASTVAASAVTRTLVGGGPIYGQRTFAVASAWELLSYAVLGALGAMAAIAFKRVLALFEHVFERYPLRQPWRAATGGLIVGLVALVIPEVAGNGYEPLNRLLDGSLAAGLVIALLAAKWLATSGSVASGIPGGVFTPVLLTGGIVGSLWGRIAGALWHTPQAAPGSLALVGMASAAAASIHAPLTAAVMVFELSGDYAIVLPLLTATVVATSLAKALGSDSLYESELKRKGLSWELTLEGRQVGGN